MMEVRGPDGRVVRFPDGTDPETVKTVMSQVYAGHAATPPQAPQTEGGLGSVVRGAANGITAGWADKAAAGLEAIVPGIGNAGTQTIWGGHSLSDAYSHNKQIELAQTKSDEGAHPWISGASNVGGAVALAAGTAGLGTAAGIPEAASLASPIARTAVALAPDVAYGASYGAGQSNAETAGGQARDAAYGAGGGVIGHGVGAVASKAIGGAVGAFGPRTLNALGGAADRLGINLMPADAGGTATRMASGLSRVTLGEVPMAQAAQASLASAQAARDGIASGIGNVADQTGAGQALQRGAQSFIKSSEDRGSQLYDAIPIAHDANATLDATRSALANLTRGLDSNPELSKIWAENPRLQATRDAITSKETQASRAADLTDAHAGVQDASGAFNHATQMHQLTPSSQSAQALNDAGQKLSTAQQALTEQVARAGTPIKDGSVSWGDLKRFRTIVGQIVGQPGLASDGATNDSLRSLYGAVSSDMGKTAEANGDGALQAFNRANQYWRGRQGRIDGVLSGILGKNLNQSAEGAFSQVNRWAQNQGGNFDSLSRAMRSMPDEEANTVRATILHSMGQPAPGAANSGAAAFSPAQFSTQWNKVSDRAKSVLFPNGVDLAKIRDLATVTDAMKGASQYANTSKTSLATNAIALLTAAINGHPIAAPIAALGQLGAGKALSSNAFAKHLASNPTPLVRNSLGALPAGGIIPARMGQSVNALLPAVRKSSGAAGAVLGIQAAHKF